MDLIALFSVYEEEHHMLNAAIDSASNMDERFVVDGTTRGMKNEFDVRYENKRTPNGTPYLFCSGWFKSDADKRTEILKEAQAWNEDGWAIWIDGDEILLYGEYLKDHCIRASQETGTGGTTIRIVEYDGSVAQCFGKIIRLRGIRRYIMSSYEVEIDNGLVVALPNVPICTAGGIPIGDIKSPDDPLLALNRPPVIGEPHLLHRHGLRSPERESPRLHNEEAKDFEQLVKEGK